MEKRAIIADLGGGVHRVTLPLPWALDHVHCYAVDDPDGWTIFDAGLGTPGTPPAGATPTPSSARRGSAA